MKKKDATFIKIKIESAKNIGGLPQVKREALGYIREASLHLNGLVKYPDKVDFERTVQSAQDYITMGLAMYKACNV